MRSDTENVEKVVTEPPKAGERVEVEGTVLAFDEQQSVVKGLEGFDTARGPHGELSVGKSLKVQGKVQAVGRDGMGLLTVE